MIDESREQELRSLVYGSSIRTHSSNSSNNADEVPHTSKRMKRAKMIAAEVAASEECDEPALTHRHNGPLSGAVLAELICMFAKVPQLSVWCRPFL